MPDGPAAFEVQAPDAVMGARGLTVLVAAAVLGTCGRPAGPSSERSTGSPVLVTQAVASAIPAATSSSAAAASLGATAPGIHVHTGTEGVETILGVRVLEVTPTSLRGQWNQEQVLLRSGPNTRFAQVEPDGQVRFDTGHDFSTAGIATGDRLNLAVDWSDRSVDGAYLVVLATKL